LYAKKIAKHIEDPANEPAPQYEALIRINIDPRITHQLYNGTHVDGTTVSTFAKEIAEKIKRIRETLGLRGHEILVYFNQTQIPQNYSLTPLQTAMKEPRTKLPGRRETREAGTDPETLSFFKQTVDKIRRKIAEAIKTEVGADIALIEHSNDNLVRRLNDDKSKPSPWSKVVGMPGILAKQKSWESPTISQRIELALNQNYIDTQGARTSGTVPAKPDPQTTTEYSIVNENNEQATFTLEIKNPKTLYEVENKEEQLTIFFKTLELIREQHRQNHTHFDIKQQNILVDEDGEPILSDFETQDNPENIRLMEVKDFFNGVRKGSVMHGYLFYYDASEPTPADPQRADLFSLATTLMSIYIGDDQFWKDYKKTIYPMTMYIYDSAKRKNQLTHGGLTDYVNNSTKIPEEIKPIIIQMLSPHPLPCPSIEDLKEALRNTHDFLDDL
jgi:serine/threonine protein kinase